MKIVVAVFTSRDAAERAAQKLLPLGIPHEHISLLSPDHIEQQVEAVPVIQAEQPGIGGALGGLVGGAAGIAGGVQLGMAAASVMVPGVGPVLAIGLFGAVLFGATGALTGAALGKSLDDFLSEGLPEDELYVYKDALRKGHSVVIALTEGESQTGDVRRALAEAGAESVDQARQAAWLGLHNAASEKYADEQHSSNGHASPESAEAKAEQGKETKAGRRSRSRKS
jgi:hypothetical protein